MNPSATAVPNGSRSAAARNVSVIAPGGGAECEGRGQLGTVHPPRVGPGRLARRISAPIDRRSHEIPAAPTAGMRPTEIAEPTCQTSIADTASVQAGTWSVRRTTIAPPAAGRADPSAMDRLGFGVAHRPSIPVGPRRVKAGRGAASASSSSWTTGLAERHGAWRQPARSARRPERPGTMEFAPANFSISRRPAHTRAAVRHRPAVPADGGRMWRSLPSCSRSRRRA